jgi:uncharacterized membrane protein
LFFDIRWCVDSLFFFLLRVFLFVALQVAWLTAPSKKLFRMAIRQIALSRFT